VLGVVVLVACLGRCRADDGFAGPPPSLIISSAQSSSSNLMTYYLINNAWDQNSNMHGYDAVQVTVPSIDGLRQYVVKGVGQWTGGKAVNVFNITTVPQTMCYSNIQVTATDGGYRPASPSFTRDCVRVMASCGDTSSTPYFVNVCPSYAPAKVQLLCILKGAYVQVGSVSVPSWDGSSSNPANNVVQVPLCPKDGPAGIPMMPFVGAVIFPGP
jgi:hypothetical protein